MLCTSGDGRIAGYEVLAYTSSNAPSTVAWCEQCYELLSPNMVIVCATRIERPAESILLPIEDWQRILRRYALPTDMADLRILVRYARQGNVLFAGIYVASAYRLLFLDTEQLIWLDAVQDDTFMRICCAQMGREMSATLVQ